MKATGIVRRVDDLGRIVIPREIRKSIGIKEGDPLEIFVDGKTVMFEKYRPSTEELAEECAKFVSKIRNNIASIGCYGDSTTVILKSGKTATVVKHYSDAYDINVAICYALAKMGMINYDNPVVDKI